MSQQNFETVKLAVENKIAFITITRPEALNALNSEVLMGLAMAVNFVKGNFPQEVRAVVITGAGEKAFVAGADIKELSELTVTQGKEFAARGQKIFRSLEKLPVPVIAAVNGFALGGGLELALACDFIVAADTAKLGLPETNLGLIPGFGGTVRLSRVVGINRARQMIFSAQTLTASEALAAGLVNQVVPKSELMTAVRAIVDQILSKGPLAVRAAKEAILSTYDVPVDEGLAIEAETFGQLFDLKDTKEGTTAFLQKRKADFKAE